MFKLGAQSLHERMLALSAFALAAGFALARLGNGDFALRARSATARMKLSTFSRSSALWTVPANCADGLVTSCYERGHRLSKSSNAKSRGGAIGAGGGTSGGGPSRMAAISGSSSARLIVSVIDQHRVRRALESGGASASQISPARVSSMRPLRVAARIAASSCFAVIAPCGQPVEHARRHVAEIGNGCRFDYARHIRRRRRSCWAVRRLRSKFSASHGCHSPCSKCLRQSIRRFADRDDVGGFATQPCAIARRADRVRCALRYLVFFGRFISTTFVRTPLPRA